MTFRLWERWGPLAGVLSVAFWIVGFALIAGTPSTGDADEKIRTYFTHHSHQKHAFLGFLVFVVGAIFFIGFLAALRERLLAAEGAPGRLTAWAYAAGVASVTLLVVSIALFAGPGTTAGDTHRFRLDANTYRLFQDTGYLVWVSATMVGATLVWAASLIALRSALLPRWLAWAGLVVGVIQLFAILFVPAFVYWGWIAATAALLTWRKHVVPAP